ncbi:hypothetical protein WJU16_01695 [Chitinophaga pollutisoli]|uniref:HEAT repeat domain-containing protein n=1 Tax=Chitinophaga pollutisoli TaxID=3133966 RepID=A0ABZ2YPP9_9BACT
MLMRLFALFVTFFALGNLHGQNRTQACLDVLRQAMERSPQFLVRMHAAEALIANGYRNGIAAHFPLHKKLGSIERTGSARVRARLGRRRKMARVILHEFRHADSARSRLTALESLAKIGYRKTPASIRSLADRGSGGFRAMAAWVVANQGTAEGKARLEMMLSSPDAAESYYAAYALRFSPSVSAVARGLLDSCATHVQPGNPGWSLVLSAYYAHASPQDLQRARQMMVQCLHGSAGERYQVGEGLAIRGKVDDLPFLDKLLADGNEDVRVSAANAVLQILKRNKL